MAEKVRPVAESGVPEERWKNVHPLTPVINSWQLIAAIIAFTLWQNPEIITYLRDPEVSEILQQNGAALYASLTLLGILALLFVSFYFEWRRTTYAVGDEAVWFRHGILMRQQRHARYDRVQAVDIVHPLLGRMFGLGKLHIEVAGGSDSNVEIAYLKTSELEFLRQQITALVTRGGAPIGAANPGNAGESAAMQNAGENNLGAESQLVSGMQVEERPLYAVPTERHLMSLIRSDKLIVSVLILLTVLPMIIVPILVTGEREIGFAMLPGILPLLLIPVGMVWSELSGNFAFSAYLTPAGIRVQRGLTDTRSQTIPPKRVHAVEVSQPLLWRGPDWYRVRILQAGYVGQDEKSDSNILLSVGTRHEAELAMWLVQPDLGVPDPLALVNAAITGDRNTPDPYFVNVPERAKKIDWFSWKRRAFALTNTALIIRDGWLQRRLTIVPVERLQSLSVHIGPLQRRLRLASVHMQMVPGRLHTAAYHLDAEQAEAMFPEILRRAQQRRQREDVDTWRQRISGDLNAYPDSDEPAAQPSEGCIDSENAQSPVAPSQDAPSIESNRA